MKEKASRRNYVLLDIGQRASLLARANRSKTPKKGDLFEKRATYLAFRDLLSKVLGATSRRGGLKRNLGVMWGGGDYYKRAERRMRQGVLYHFGGGQAKRREGIYGGNVTN